MTLKNIAIGGYRSFGSVQYFDKFAKINLFIGRNNSGKSNILRFINEIYSFIGAGKNPKIDTTTKHLPSGEPLVIGVGDDITIDSQIIDEIPRFNGEDFSRLSAKCRVTILEIFKKNNIE